MVVMVDVMMVVLVLVLVIVRSVVVGGGPLSITVDVRVRMLVRRLSRWDMGGHAVGTLCLLLAVAVKVA